MWHSSLPSCSDLLTQRKRQFLSPCTHTNQYLLPEMLQNLAGRLGAAAWLRPMGPGIPTPAPGMPPAVALGAGPVRMVPGISPSVPGDAGMPAVEATGCS